MQVPVLGLGLESEPVLEPALGPGPVGESVPELELEPARSPGSEPLLARMLESRPSPATGQATGPGRRVPARVLRSVQPPQRVPEPERMPANRCQQPEWQRPPGRLRYRHRHRKLAGRRPGPEMKSGICPASNG